MLLCLACNLDPFAHRNSHSGRAPADGALALEPREALRLLSRSASTTLGHVKLTHARIFRSGLYHNPALLPSLLRLYSSHCRLDLAARLLATFPTSHHPMEPHDPRPRRRGRPSTPSFSITACSPAASDLISSPSPSSSRPVRCSWRLVRARRSTPLLSSLGSGLTRSCGTPSFISTSAAATQ
ncbi:unnamed protein product [Musa acuminata var. zebrina]